MVQAGQPLLPQSQGLPSMMAFLVPSFFIKTEVSSSERSLPLSDDPGIYGAWVTGSLIMG